jgi:hypothetical protein
MMEALYTSETSVYSNDTARHYIPEDSGLHINSNYVGFIALIFSVVSLCVFVLSASLLLFHF